MHRTLPLVAVAACATALIACGKVQEAASEKAAEKMIESALEKDGGKANVDLSGGSTRITTTDASGKTSQLEFGAAQVSEADIGVPFYPGTQPTQGQSSKVTTPDGTLFTVMLHSDDAAAKVAAFYRDKLKAQSEGKQFLDMSGGDGSATLGVADEKGGRSIQVLVSKVEQGTDVQIVASRRGAK